MTRPRTFVTDAVHAGRPARPDPYHAHVPPLYQTSTFSFDSVEEGRRAFAGEEGGASHIYTRLGNPTMDALERGLAALEGHGVGEPCGGLAFGSGMAAITSTIIAAAGGGRVVAQEALYGCTSEFLNEQAEGLGIAVTFVDGADTDAVIEALDRQPDTKLLYLETPANPTLSICDLPALCAAARERGIAVCVDNTFATPYHQRPLAHGADLVVHSTTKYVGGHGTVIGGAVVARQGEMLDRIAAFRKNLGGIPGPFDCWLLLNGLKTLPLRLERHSANAQRVAEWLAAHPGIAVVHYPGLPDHPGHERAKRQMENGFGGVMSFELAAGFEAGVTMMEAVELCTLAVSLGTVDTLIQHPASMTHSVMDPEIRRRAGVTDGLVRLAVGIESAEDIIADLEAALDAANR
jgi:methionine-gamma-lyase